MQTEIIATEALGNRGYVIHDGQYGLAVDVQRDFGRWQEAAARAGVTITHVFETHMHNDYVTGGYQLARATGAQYVVPARSGQSFAAAEAADGQEFQVGSLTVRALHTPGHTAHHMSYAVSDGTSSVVCTGGSLLYGTVGRSDLVAPGQTRSLAEAQFESAHKLVRDLAPETAVLPTHGFGSFCSSSDGSGATSSTLGSEAQLNVALTHDKQTFIDLILGGLGPYPRYYAHMSLQNQNGPGPVPALHIHEYASEDIARALAGSAAWVVDVRSRRAFSARHPQGAYGFELGRSFATYLGWLAPWEQEIILVGEEERSLQEAYLELSRIGMDAFVSGATASLETYFAAAPSRSYETKTFQDLSLLAASGRAPYVLDVRLPVDWAKLHVQNSVNIPLHELSARLHELPLDAPIWVHCASGYRASIAASLIDRSGRMPVLIDDKFEQAVPLRLTK